MKYVIIGNSAAGIGAAEGIRSVDKTGEIVIVTEEKYHTYGRPLISYYLQGATDMERMKYRPSDFYEKNGIAVLYSRRAECFDPAVGEVTLADGEKIGYDRLLLACGSVPFAPPMEGIETVRDRFSFLTLDDALALKKRLGRRKSVLIVGAGLIGLKCFEGIADSVGSVYIVDLADRILPSVLDEQGAEIVRRALERRGAKFFLSDSVVRFEGNKAYLKSGKELDFDLLVTAVGVRPNTRLAAQAGCEIARGIVTDERQETSLRGVYAAGDCAESFDLSSGTRRVLALLPNAYRQGYCAGVNMAGGTAAFGKAIPLNAVGFFGTRVLTAGSYVGECYAEREGESYRALFYKDGVLKGFILVNKPERAGIYTSLIREQTPLGRVDFGLLKREPCLAAFPEQARGEMLAREV